MCTPVSGSAAESAADDGCVRHVVFVANADCFDIVVFICRVLPFFSLLARAHPSLSLSLSSQ